VSQAAPESWEPLRSRIAALLARRETVLEETAAAWARFAREAGWSRSDIEALWEGLTEDLVRRYARDREAAADVVRQDVLAAMAALRARLLRGLQGGVGGAA
jgi:hypothetical protein